MQSVVSLDTTDIYTDKKRPSARLQEKIRNCVSMFRSLNETVNEVIALGQKEGFSSKEIGHFIREEMLKSGLSRRTVTRYLPSELKAQPRGLSKHIRDKMSQNQGQGQIQTSQLTTSSTVRDKMSQNQSHAGLQLIADDIDIEAFSMSAEHLKPEILGKVIDNLAQIYNKKTGQQIKVIFRKMIDDGSSSTSNKDKKYQPTPDEVKQRENKVLSLVKKGIVKISEIVEQSGVSESATRRYLLKAGYKITAGIVSR
jgi:hypothetical protein